MRKIIKSTELRRDEISNSGQFYSSKTIVKQFDNNSLLIKETYKYEQAQNNGHSNIEEVKEFNEGKLIRMVKKDFTKTYQIDYSYFDNVQIVETKLIYVDNSDVAERSNEFYLENYESLNIKENYSDLKKIQTKRLDLNDLISVEKRFLDIEGKVVKITFEDFESSKKNFVTEIKFRDTSLEFDNNGLFVNEITKKEGVVVSEKNIHHNGNKCETSCNFNSYGIVRDVENKIVFSDNNISINVLQSYIRLKDNSFQLKRLKLEIVHKELDSYLHKVDLIFEYNEWQQGKILSRIEDINLFQVLDSNAEIWSKVESLFSDTDKCNFQYFRIIDGRPLEEIDTQFTFKDVFENISDILPVTLIFENTINRFMDEGNYINYIQIPFSPDNQDYYLRVWNNQKCGYYKVEYS